MLPLRPEKSQRPAQIVVQNEWTLAIGIGYHDMVIVS